MLLGATAAALIWANSALAETYEAFWNSHLSLSLGSWSLDMDLRHWVNDALMALFFFVVGLEIKRELVAGELSDRRKALLPAVAAVGGMVGPALIYLAINPRGPEAHGWGIPMATDIAFAVGVLALLGSRVPAGLKVFLLSLAIVDDIGAIGVIALFYSGDLLLGWLAAAAAMLILVVFLRRARVLWVPFYAVVGVFVWYLTLRSGVHATIAGVALGLLSPALPTDPRGFEDVLREANDLPGEPDAQSLRSLTLQGNEVVSVAERLGYALHPWTSFLVIPVFALANAGLSFEATSMDTLWTSPVALGVLAGLVIGKLGGITLFSWIALRLGIAELPDGMDRLHLAGGAAVAGIGFTVSLFITDLAFADRALVDAAKLGVFIASALAGTIGAVVLLWHRGVHDTES